MGQLPPWYLVSRMQQTSTFLRDSVSTTSQTLPLRVFTFTVPTLNFLRWLLDSPQWTDPASHTWQEAKPETLPTELWCLLAPPNSDSILVIAMKNFETIVFMGLPVLADIPIQFFNSIWACTPFPHSSSVLCRFPYKERIVCQTTIVRTPSHRSVEDCCLPLPPRLWQPHNPKGWEATVLEGSLTFPHSCWVSQLDAVLRHTQDKTSYKYQSTLADMQSARTITLTFILIELFLLELCPSQNCVHSVTWYLFKISSRNFI